MLTGILLLAFIAESMTEYFFDTLPKYQKYIAAGVGILLAVAFRINGLVTFDFIDFSSALAYWVAVILTGLVIGRGANFVHDVMQRISTGTASTVIVNAGLEKV